jgi:hypothetical protein
VYEHCGRHRSEGIEPTREAWQEAQDGDPLVVRPEDIDQPLQPLKL